MVILAIYVLAFVAVVVLIQTLAGLVFASRDREQRVNRRLTMLASGMEPEKVYDVLVRSKAAGERGTFAEQVGLWVRQAGLNISPLRLALMTLGGAVGLWLVGLALLASRGALSPVSAVMALVGASAFAGLAAYVYVSSRRTARLKQLEEQLPLALDIVNRAIRAGHPVVSAVQLAANEMGDPIGSEFGLIVDETTYGAEFRDALLSFARRTGSSDAHFFAVSVGIQSETGGNLAQILEGLAGVIRGRATLAKRVKALSSEGNASAAILSILPVLLIGGFCLFQPSFYTDHFDDPVFWPIAGVVFVVFVIGQFIIRRIVDIRY